jgi:hypothetical protein
MTELKLAADVDLEREQCVAVLEVLLARAKAGEFREFAFVATPADRSEDAFAHWTPTTSLIRMIGAVSVLHSTLLARVRVVL